MLLRPIQAALLLAFPLMVLADQVSDELDPVVVTATRTAQTVDETLASVTVITRVDIERLQARSVQDLLRGTAGLSIANNGGTGKATSFFLRGTESDHVLVLIDGVKVGSATTGSTAFQDIPVELIDRIEVVRGPRSSLYGSEAIGGVIQIFTRQNRGPVRPTLSIGGGSFGTFEAAAGLSGGNEKGWFSAYLSGLDTDGFNACSGRPSPGGAGCFTNEPDRDGYRNLSGSLRAGLRVGTDAEIDVHWLRTTGSNAFDGGFVNESRTAQQVLGTGARFSLTGNWRVSLAAAQSRDESDNSKDGAFRSRFDTRRDTASWQNDVALGGGQLLTVGLDWQNDRVESTTAYTVASRDNEGLFAQYQHTFGSQDVQLSLRRDDNEQFGDRTTGGVGWGYAFGPNLRLTALYGTAFKAPTFNELYFPGFGNPALQPEDSRSLEFGLGGGGGATRWSVNAFETRIDDLIAYDASIRAANNLEQARIRGVEAILGTRLGAWSFRSHLTVLDPENRSAGADFGKILPRRAEQALRLDVDRDFGDYGLGATAHAEGGRFDDLANTRELGGYARFDLRGEYRLSRTLRLQARVANLFDKEYETAAFFNQPRRSAFLTLRYQP